MLAGLPMCPLFRRTVECCRHHQVLRRLVGSKCRRKSWWIRVHTAESQRNLILITTFRCLTKIFVSMRFKALRKETVFILSDFVFSRPRGRGFWWAAGERSALLASWRQGRQQRPQGHHVAWPRPARDRWTRPAWHSRPVQALSGWPSSPLLKSLGLLHEGHYDCLMAALWER